MQPSSIGIREPKSTIADGEHKLGLAHQLRHVPPTPTNAPTCFEAANQTPYNYFPKRKRYPNTLIMLKV